MSEETNKIFKYSITPNGIEEIFSLITSNDYIDNTKIKINISLQIYSSYYNSAYGFKYYTLCDFYHNYDNFIFEINELQCLPNHIINIKEITSNYNYSNHFFIIQINKYEHLSNALYQIYPKTIKYDISKYTRKFKYYVKPKIDLLKYDTISRINKIGSYIKLYIRVITKTTIVGFEKDETNYHKGNFFCFDVIDFNNETLRINAIKDNAEYFYKDIKINSIYEIKGNFSKQKIIKDFDLINDIYLSGDYIKPKYEISIGNETKIIELEDNNDLSKIDENKYLKFWNFYKILNYNFSNIQLVNTIGYVLKVGICFKKINALRNILLIDTSNNIIELDLWNQFTLLPIKEGNVLLIKNIQVKKRGDDNINCLTSVDETKIIINPNNERDNFLKKFILYSNINLKNENKLECFINEIIKLKNPILKKNERNFIKVINCYIVDLITDINDLIIEGCLEKNCFNQKLIKNQFFWFCNKCKKQYIFPGYYFNDWIIKISDCSGEINCILKKEIITYLINLTPNQIKLKTKNNILELLDLKSEFLFYTKCEKDTNDNLIILKIEKISNKKNYIINTLINNIKQKLKQIP